MKCQTFIPALIISIIAVVHKNSYALLWLYTSMVKPILRSIRLENTPLNELNDTTHVALDGY